MSCLCLVDANAGAIAGSAPWSTWSAPFEPHLPLVPTVGFWQPVFREHEHVKLGARCLGLPLQSCLARDHLRRLPVRAEHFAAVKQRESLFQEQACSFSGVLLQAGGLLDLPKDAAHLRRGIDLFSYITSYTPACISAQLIVAFGSIADTPLQ